MSPTVTRRREGERTEGASRVAGEPENQESVKKFKRRRGVGYVSDGFVFVVSKTVLMKSDDANFSYCGGMGRVENR